MRSRDENRTSSVIRFQIQKFFTTRSTAMAMADPPRTSRSTNPDGQFIETHIPVPNPYSRPRGSTKHEVITPHVPFPQHESLSASTSLLDQGCEPTAVERLYIYIVYNRSQQPPTFTERRSEKREQERMHERQLYFLLCGQQLS